MTVNVPDRFKAANAFWIGLGKIGLTPAAVLGQARVPVTVYDGKKNLVTTAQFFALWRAVGELSSDAAAGLKIATQIDVGNRPPSTMAAWYARDYRDALARLARFKQLCTPHLRTSAMRMAARGRAAVHNHLREVLVELIGHDLKAHLKRRTRTAGSIPPDLLVCYIASTFIVVLEWWGT
jgi:hypothetical protein